MTDYQSSVLRCDPGDDDCPTCKFLAGNRSVGVLMAVIENLDHCLAKSETAFCALALTLANNE